MSKPNSVVVHPLVLLSVVDHYNRVAADTNKRVVGILLGATIQGKTDITNSYAVPFEEDDKDPSIWFLDHNYHENMYAMFKKVNAREKVVGWYSTGPKIRANDIDIHQLMQKFTPNPVYVIVDVKPKDVGIPTDSYIAVEEIQDEKSEPKLTFAHIPSEIGALEAEEVGVEHLLRDIKDTTVSDLQSSVAARLSSLSALKTRLGGVLTYLENVVDGKLPINHSILYLLQDIFNLLPGLQESEIQEAFRTQTNDTMLTIYVSSVVRTIIALHNLVNNKKDLKEAEQEREEKAKQKKKEKREKERAEREKLEIKEKAEKEKAEGKKKQQEH